MVKQKLEIEESDLGGGWVEAYYMNFPTLRAMVVQEGIPSLRTRLYEVAARGLEYVPQATQRLLAREHNVGSGDFIFCVPRSSLEANALLVRAVSEVLEDMEPGWISALEKARGSTGGDPDAMAFWSKVPIEAVLAVRERRTRL